MSHSDTKPVFDIFLLDLACIVPYYTGSLYKQLKKLGISIALGSTTYRFDPGYFKAEGLILHPGLVDSARWQISIPVVRQTIKLVELCVNLSALSLRFLVSRPTVVHVQYLPLLDMGIPIESWFLRLWQRMGIKIVHTVHNELPLDTGERYRKRFESSYAQADALICHTRHVKQLLIAEYSIAPSRIHVIAHGLLFGRDSLPACKESREHFQRPASGCVFLFQGWIKRYKGLRFLLESWKELGLDPDKARLVIVGGGDRQIIQELQDLIQSLGIAASVHFESRFVNPVTELPAYIQAADVVVLPYQNITTSAALMTVAPYAKPLIATDLPFFREVLGDAVPLVQFGDCKQMAAQLRRLALDVTERERLHLAVAKRFCDRQFSWEHIARKTVECYEHVARNA